MLCPWPQKAPWGLESEPRSASAGPAVGWSGENRALDAAKGAHKGHTRKIRHAYLNGILTLWRQHIPRRPSLHIFEGQYFELRRDPARRLGAQLIAHDSAQPRPTERRAAQANATPPTVFFPLVGWRQEERVSIFYFLAFFNTCVSMLRQLDSTSKRGATH